MVLLPSWNVTRRVINSFLPFVALADLHLYLLAGTLTEKAAQAMSNPDLADTARFFADEWAAAAGWVDSLVMDLFVGRWIYLEAKPESLKSFKLIALPNKYFIPICILKSHFQMRKEGH